MVERFEFDYHGVRSITDMTVIKINAITVPADSGDELARRFAARAGAVDNQDGFEGFELFKPTDERTTWLVVTRWRDESAFQAWVNSPAFGRTRTPIGGRTLRGRGRTAGRDTQRVVVLRDRGWEPVSASSSSHGGPR